MTYLITAENIMNHKALDELLERITREEEKRIYAWIEDLEEGGNDAHDNGRRRGIWPYQI
jgi:hypothetical protein